jgi:hypothetical protein
VSLGELRAALDGVRGLTEEAHGHAGVAGERLDEVVALLSALSTRSGTTMPTEDFAHAREEVAALVDILGHTATLVDEFANRL